MSLGIWLEHDNDVWGLSLEDAYLEVSPFCEGYKTCIYIPSEASVYSRNDNEEHDTVSIAMDVAEQMLPVFRVQVAKMESLSNDEIQKDCRPDPEGCKYPRDCY